MLLHTTGKSNTHPPTPEQEMMKITRFSPAITIGYRIHLFCFNIVRFWEPLQAF